MLNHPRKSPTGKPRIFYGWYMVGTAGSITFDLTGSYYWIFIIQTALELRAAVFAFAISRGASLKK